MQMSAFPRTLVRRSLRGMRLLLDTAEVLARRAGMDVDDHWLPAVAYEGFEADAKRLIGSLLRDEELVDDGRRQWAETAQLRHALQLHAVADDTRARTGSRIDQRRKVAAEQRHGADG